MLPEINATQFCDLQGVNASDRFVIEKKFSKVKQSYEKWYEQISAIISLSPIKTFSTKNTKADTPAENSGDKKSAAKGATTK